MSAPAVTVLLPVYNGMPFLPSAIRSILAQTFSDFELLVIDDGSSDDSYSAAKSIQDPRMRVVRNETNLGLPATLNRGLEMALGKWIARQDQDDLSNPDRLERQLAQFEGRSNLGAVFSDAQIMDARGCYAGRIRSAHTPPAIRWDLCFRNTLPHSVAMFRRDLVLESGGYRDLANCEDYDLWSRLAATHDIESLEHPLLSYRVHSTSMMGRDHAARAARSREPRREIMRRNWLNVSGAAVDEALIGAWLDEGFCDWKRYFAAREKELNKFLQQFQPGTDFARVLADEDYSLFFLKLREGRGAAMSFFAALIRSRPAHLLQLPFARMAAALILSR